MTSRTPPLLEPYVTPLPAESSLAVLTSVLGASTNWLVLRYLHALLRSTPPTPTPSPSPVAGEEAQQQEASVLLVSFLRDWAFWREGLARLGVDLEGAAARRGRFGFVDGLGIFSGGGGHDGFATGGPQQRPSSRTGSGPGTAASGGGGGGGGRRALTGAAPGDMAPVILEGVEALKRGSNGTTEGKERKVVLVIDGLDFVLAASDPDKKTGSVSGTAMALREMLMDLREQTHAVIITLAADDPLIKEQETALEKQHAWWALSLVHEADTVLSLRLLDTGAAKDVSGVIRITRGGAKLRSEDREYLYHVGGDGGVRVFERGQ